MISHICLGCGLDLARRCARLEPVYGLAMVTCPRCGWSCARRRHPLVTRWRQGRHAAAAAGVLFAQLFVALLMVWLIVAGDHYIADQMTQKHQSLRATLAWTLGVASPPDQFVGADFSPFTVGVWLWFSALAGVWLGSCFPHWRWWKLSLAWAALLIAAMSAGAIAWALFKPMAILASAPAPYSGPDLASWLTLGHVVVFSAALTGAFFPIGPPARRAWRRSQRRRWRKGLTKARRARRGE